MRAHLSRPDSSWVVPVSCEDWDDKENSTPIDDADAAVAAYVAKTGYWPKVIEVDLEAHRALQGHPLILDRLKHVDVVCFIRPTPQLLALVFDVDEYRIAGVYPDPRTSHARDRAMDDVNVRARLCVRRFKEILQKTPVEPHTMTHDSYYLRAGLTQEELVDFKEWCDAFYCDVPPPPLSPFLNDFVKLLGDRD